MQNFIFCQIFSVLFHPVSFPVLLLPAVPAFLPLSTVFLFSPSFGVTPHSFFPAASFFLPPAVPAFSPPASFSYFCLSDTPLLFSPFSFNPFLHLASRRFFSPGASPPEHNISEHKPKHTDASFCRPKRRTRQIIKISPGQQEGIKNTRPDRPKFRTSKHRQNKFCLRPGKYAKRQKTKASRPEQSITRSKPQMPQTLQKPTANLKSPYLPCLHGHLNHLP